MQADVRTYKAPTLDAALELVRREMGADAIVLHTRQVTRRGLLPWSRGREEVEITAGLGVQVRSTPKPTVESSMARTAAAGISLSDETLQPPPDLLGTKAVPLEKTQPAPAAPVNRLASVTNPPVRHQQRETETPVGRHPGTKTIAARLAAISPTMPEIAPAPAAVTPPPVSVAPPVVPPAPVPRSMTRERSVSETPVPPRLPTPSVAAARYVPSSDPTLAIQQRLDMLQKMLTDLGRQNRGKGAADIPAELFSSFTQLIDAEVDEDVARDVVLRLRSLLSPMQRKSPEAVQAVLAVQIEKELRVGTSITPQRGRRKVIALVGPTGVGKTTTIAKLAANFRLRDGAKLGLITVDTYRVAAVEQLRTYAEIMDLPMKVVTSPQEMRRALDELTGLDLVLIDTAGRSPKDELKLQELKTVLAEARPDEVHLVMSLASGSRVLQTTAAQFQPAGVTSLILTKLDEASGPGSLLNVARSVPVPVSYLTTGQDVPADIEPAHAARMARLITGQESLSATSAGR